MSQAIISLTSENLWSRKLSRRFNSHVHWILQVIGAACNIAGVYVMWRGGRFRTTHAILGIVSVGSVIVIFITGIPALFAARLRKVVRPVIGKFIHNFLGLMCFVVGMLAQMYGYNKRWLRSQVSSEVVLLFIVTTAMITCFSVIGSIRSLWEQLKGLFNCR